MSRFTKDKPKKPGWYAYGSKKGAYAFKHKGYMEIAIAPEGVVLHRVPSQILSNGVVLYRWEELRSKRGEVVYWRGPITEKFS